MGKVRYKTLRKFAKAKKEIGEKIKEKNSRNTPNAYQQEKQGFYDEAVNAFESDENAFNKRSHEILEKNAGGSEQVMYKRLTNDRDNLIADLRGAKNEEQRTVILKDAGIKYDDNVAGMSANEFANHIDKFYAGKAKDGPSMFDRVNAHPFASYGAAAVLGGTALELASSRGQKSNAELYSDPF